MSSVINTIKTKGYCFYFTDIHHMDWAMLRKGKNVNINYVDQNVKFTITCINKVVSITAYFSFGGIVLKRKHSKCSFA
jgi:hypothetical protein